GQAFELMQRSEHIGKIVVQPPPLQTVPRADAAFRVDPEGTHVITGGFGGFGLEAAKWLVERGARHLVLIGRHGARTDEAKKVLAELAARQVSVHKAACDVADRRAITELLEEVNATMPPVVGILHAAMVLDDGLLANLDARRFRRVLAPKVQGAENLDLLTRGMALDYFVLFSSATTLMGNPGQGNYVAANAYMEALARRRRQNGLKALAIGWGPIIDVGVLANSERLRSRFQKLTGVRGMRARDALDLMAQALALPSAPSLAVMTISQTDGLFTADRLAVLKSPTYLHLAAKGQNEMGAATSALDLRAIAQAEGLDGLRRRLTDIIVTSLARVLRAREEEISRVRPLSDIGLDSLMALEFAMNLEDRFGIHVAMTSAVGSLTVGSLANEIMAQINLDDGPTGTMVKTITEHHVNKAAPHELEILQEIVGDHELANDAKKRRVLS
ncbi:MAG TPA: SDR family NAD(P)-dependent oxidoreductase, partial [Xanthobacteraceae bacterium]|nr:SDR family NAD(P)-dependent oxidoreductase [Xanthobacteraceae bacterium]